MNRLWSIIVNYYKDNFYTIIKKIEIIIFLILAAFIIKIVIERLIKLFQHIKRFIKTYGEDKLYLRTIKRIRKLNFLETWLYENIKQKNYNSLSQFYYPSLISLIFIVGFCYLLFNVFNVLSLFKIPLESPWGIKFLPENNYCQNFIAIHSGIGAIIFAFLILIVETSNSGKNQNKARVILKETLLFPLATFEILSLILFSFDNNYLGSMLSVVLVGIFTIRAIYKVIRLFINRCIFLEAESQLINDRFLTRLDQLVEERIAANTLLEYFEKSEYAIDYSYFRPSKENIKTFSLSKKGVIKDIHLGKLGKLLNEIEKEANRIDRTIKKIPQTEKKAGRITNTITSKNGKTLTPVQISILKLIGGQVVDDSKEIISIPKSLFEVDEIRKRIQKSIDLIFKVKLEDTAEKEIRLELDEAKDKAFSAIEDSKIGILNSVMDTYVGLIDQFLNVFESYGGGYTFEAAIKERNSLVGGWPYIKWIREDLWDVISETIKSEKEKLITEITYTPMKILYKAYIKKDHLIFQEFMSFQPYLYYEAKNVKDQNIKKFLIDRSTRYFKEFMEYKVTPNLENQDLNTDDIFQIRDFVYEVLQSYKNLLKYAFDRKDVKSFKKIFTDTQSLLHRFEPTEDHQKVWIETQLKLQNITDLERKELQEKLNKITLLEELEKNIKLKKSEMIFGFASWCLFKLKELNFNNEELLSIWNFLLPHLPTNLEKLFEIYESSFKLNTQGFWGWDWWEMERNHEDEDGIITASINFDDKVHELFVLLLLKSLKGKTLAQVDISKIKITRDSGFFFEKDDAVAIAKLNDLSNNQNQYQKVISLEEMGAKDVAIAVLKSLADKLKQEEKKQLIKTQIDSTKVKEFIDGFVSAYEKEVSLRRILDSHKAITNIEKLTKSKNYWGFYEIQNKEPFLSSWHVDYGNNGEHYGKGLGDSEDQIIFNQIRSNSTEISEGESLDEVIKISINNLQNNSYDPDVIFITSRLSEWRMATLNKSEFIPSWKAKGFKYRDIPNFMGLYKFGRRKIPIFRILVNDARQDVSEIIVTNIRNFIELKQYPPFLKESERSEMEMRGNLAFKITDLSNESNKSLRDKLITDNPSWLQGETDKEAFLKQKVIVHVKEKFEIEVADKNASIKAKLKKDRS